MREIRVHGGGVITPHHHVLDVICVTVGTQLSCYLLGRCWAQLEFTDLRKFRIYWPFLK